MHQVAPAVKARIGLGVPRDTAAQFPTLSEAARGGVEALEASEPALCRGDAAGPRRLAQRASGSYPERR